VEEYPVGTVEISALSAVTGCLQTCLIHWESLSEGERLDLISRALRSANRAVGSVNTSIELGVPAG
jgi:hypothetical protein